MLLAFWAGVVGPGIGACMNEIRTEVFRYASAACVGLEVGCALLPGGRRCLNLSIK
jgi:hypothetical protein